MNVALKFIESLGDAVKPLAHSPMHAIMATPRFTSSRNVVFLLAPADSGRPTLVAKVARLGGRDEGLAREATNLIALQRSCPSGESVPRLVAHGVFLGHQILLETAVIGRPMTAKIVRQRPEECVDTVLSWLIDRHQINGTDSEVSGQFSALVEQPLQRLRTVLDGMPQASLLIDRVRNEAEVLRLERIPTVFEHGDLSAPNILIQADNHAGVLDWELATPDGLPASDLFFFLTFIASSIGRARAPEDCVEAFERAFFGSNAWARPHVLTYATAIGLAPRALRALFLLGWSRYLAVVPVRQAWAVRGDLGRMRAADFARDRYWHLWKFAVEHVDDFGCLP